MKTKIIQLTKNKFIRNVILVASGTAGAQAIAMLSSPFITRMYGPESYGLMGLFNSIIQVLIPIAALTYPVAIVLPKRDKHARGLAYVSLYITIGISVLLFLFILVFQNTIIETFNVEKIGPYLFLVPFAILFAGIAEIYVQWLIRNNQFQITAKTALSRSIFVNGGRLGIGIFYPFAVVLIFISALEDLFRIILIKYSLSKTKFNLKLFDQENNRQYRIKLFALAKKYKDFPIYRSPQVFIDRLSQNMPVMLLSILFNPVVTGFYTIGRTVLGIPSQLIGKSVGDVFYPRISEANNKGDKLTPLIIKSTLALGITGIVPFGIIMIFGPFLFGLIFGSEWTVAGEYARWMAFWTFCMFLNRPSTKALPVMFAQSFQLKYAIFTIIMRFIAFLLGYFLFREPLYAIAFFSIVAGLLSLGLIFMTLLISKKHDQDKKVGL